MQTSLGESIIQSALNLRMWSSEVRLKVLCNHCLCSILSSSFWIRLLDSFRCECCWSSILGASSGSPKIANNNVFRVLTQLGMRSFPLTEATKSAKNFGTGMSPLVIEPFSAPPTQLRILSNSSQAFVDLIPRRIVQLSIEILILKEDNLNRSLFRSRPCRGQLWMRLDSPSYELSWPKILAQNQRISGV